MRLPEDKAERNKVLLLIAIGGTAVLYAVVQLGIFPLLRMKKAKHTMIQELEVELDAARMVIKERSAIDQKHHEVLRQIKAISDVHVLHPRLGNYILSARELIESYANEAGVDLRSIAEIGQSPVPTSGNRTSKNAFQAYSVRVTLEANLFETARLLWAIESSNPLLSVSTVSITGQAPRLPDRHNVSFEVQWPIWADGEFAGQMQQVLGLDAPTRNEAGASEEKQPDAS